MTDKKEVILPLRLDAESFQAESVEEVVAITERVADDAQAALWRLLANSYRLDEVSNIDPEILSADKAPWSREEALDHMMNDFADYGWSIIHLDMRDASEGYQGESDGGYCYGEAIWIARVTRSDGGAVVYGRTDQPAEIEEFGYSREGALTAAWVRMRDIEKLRGN